MGKNVHGPAEPAMRTLMDYHWRGNARELRNGIERSMVVTKGRMILDTDLSLPRAPEVQNSRGKSLSEMEKEHIRQVLHDNKWNIIRSAQVLGIDPGALYNKIRKYELKKEPVLNT